MPALVSHTMPDWKVVVKTLLEFGTETSISGISNAARGKSKARSGVWCLIFLVLAYFTAGGIKEIVLEYFTFPVITTTDLSHRPELDFPAVTICNLNRVNCHNAFLAMYTIKLQIAESSSETEMKELEKSLDLYEGLLSANVTNCLYPICLNLKEKVLGGIIFSLS